MKSHTLTNHPLRDAGDLDLMSWREAADDLDYHPESLKRKSREGTFPQPVRLARNKSKLIRSEVQQWVQDRIRERDTGGAT